MAPIDGPLSDLGSAAKACLSAGLPGVALPPLTIDALAEGYSEIVREGLASTALDLINSEGLEVDKSVRNHLTRLSMAQQARCLAADATVGELLDLFGTEQIDFVIVKGPAVARFYPSACTRPYNDIDLLVEPRDFQRAMALLLSRGYTYPQTSMPPWPWFDRCCREGVNLLGSGNVDLHHHLAPWVFGSHLPSSEVIERATPINICGRIVPVASSQHSAVIAALHILNDLWKGRRGLPSWRDLIVIVRYVGFSGVSEAFEVARLEWLLGAAVRTIVLQLPGLLDVAESCVVGIPRQYRWRMRGLGWDRSTPLSRHRLAWAIRLPPPQAAAFVAGSALPSRRYIRDRHRTYRAYWAQAWSETLSTFEGADHRMDKGTHDEGTIDVQRDACR